MPHSDRTVTSPSLPAVKTSEPVDVKRIPLAEIVFNTPTLIPGAGIMLTKGVAMERVVAAGVDFVFPQPFLDLTTRTVTLLDREYPLERVHYYTRAKMAKSVPGPMPNLDQYTMGKVARRIIVTQVRVESKK